jgi:DNA-binding HxlR family transcriptional regulator
VNIFSMEKWMVMGADNVDEQRRQAEVFDALSHPTRIMILKALSEGPVGFADLKKKLGIESSGHLQHHINKLNGLVKTNGYGKYTLSDQGKDALHSVETVEKVAVSKVREKEKIHTSKKNIVPKVTVIALALLLAISSTLAVFEYNNASSFQRMISQRDNALVEHEKAITWLDTATNLIQLALNMKPPRGSQYLNTLPDSNHQGKPTKIYLLSTAPGYSYDPYPWPLTEALRNALVVPTDNESIRLPDFGWSYLPGNYTFFVGGDPVVMIGVTVRNDYTPADARNGSDPSAPIGTNPFTGSSTSVNILTAKLYSHDGSIVQAADAGIPQTSAAVGGHKFVLGSGETTQVVFCFSSPSQDIDHYEICVSYLSAYW